MATAGALTMHLPKSWTDEWLESGAYVWRDVDPEPACGGEGAAVVKADRVHNVDCPECKPYVRDCGCVAHHTRPGGMGVFCITEQNAYCNFECPHEDEEEEVA